MGGGSFIGKALLEMFRAPLFANTRAPGESLLGQDTGKVSRTAGGRSEDLANCSRLACSGIGDLGA